MPNHNSGIAASTDEHRGPECGLGSPCPRSIDGSHDPCFRAPERGEHDQRPGEPPAPRQMGVDGGQAQSRHQRIGGRDQDEVPVAGDAEHADAGEHRSGQARVAGCRGAEPVGDPAGEHRAGERARDRGHHPQPECSLPGEHGVGQREQERKRLPRWRRVQVEVEVDRLTAPHEPAVRVVRGSHTSQHDEHHGRKQDERGNDDPRRNAPPAGPRTLRRSGAVARCPPRVWRRERDVAHVRKVANSRAKA